MPFFYSLEKQSANGFKIPTDLLGVISSNETSLSYEKASDKDYQAKCEGVFKSSVL